MKKEKISKSFRGSNRKDEPLISSSARINMNNSSTGFLGMNGPQNLFNKNYSNTYLSDLKKTFNLNIDILKQYIQYNNNPINVDNTNNIITLLNSLIDNLKKKEKIIEKIKEKKSKLLIDNQISSERKRKNEEKRFYLKEKIKENEERINGKEEYMKVLHKKMREVEIYIHKNTLNVKDMIKRKKYQTFSMFDFIETNNDLIKQRKDINKQIDINKNNYKVELEENKKIKAEEKKEEELEKINKKQNNEEQKIKKISEKYKKTIKLMTLRLNLLKNTYKKVNKKIKILKIGGLKQLDSNNINNNKDDDKNDNDQSKFNLDTTFRNSFMDFSIVLNKNFDESKFDISKIGNNFGNVSNFGTYDISVINYN